MTRFVTVLAYAALMASLGLGFLVVTAHAAQPTAITAGISAGQVFEVE